MLLEFQTLFQASPISWIQYIGGGLAGGEGVGVGGELKAGSSIHLNRKAAIVCSLKCTDSYSSPARPVRSLTAV